jgi:hypothetical protein
VVQRVVPVQLPGPSVPQQGLGALVAGEPVAGVPVAGVPVAGVPVAGVWITAGTSREAGVASPTGGPDAGGSGSGLPSGAVSRFRGGV